MKNIIALIAISLCIVSTSFCQDGKASIRAVITGTWHYARLSKTEPEYTFEFEVGDSSDQSTTIAITEEDDGLDHFYLVFDITGQMIEYKVGFGFRSAYKVRNSTIYSNDEAIYEIKELTPKTLIVKQPNEPGTATYEKVVKDLGHLEVIN